MTKLISIITLGLAAAITIALVTMTGGATSASETGYAKRDDEAPELLLVDDDDADDTRDQRSRTPRDLTRTDDAGRDAPAGDQTDDRTNGPTTDQTDDQTDGPTNDQTDDQTDD